MSLVVLDDLLKKGKKEFSFKGAVKCVRKGQVYQEVNFIAVEHECLLHVVSIKHTDHKQLGGRSDLFCLQSKLQSIIGAGILAETRQAWLLYYTALLLSKQLIHGGNNACSSA